MEAIKERISLSKLAQKFDLHPNQILHWKNEFLARAVTALEQSDCSVELEQQQKESKGMLMETGRLRMENAYFKKVAMISLANKRLMAEEPDSMDLELSTEDKFGN